MGLFSTAQTDLKRWRLIESVSDLVKAIELSEETPVLLFKHSTRCSISSMALSTFNREWQLSEEQCPIYYIDLLKYREVSNEVARLTGVVHQSPQAIVMKGGSVIYFASHGAIDAESVENLVV
jgi:bacillithiol system protein YtxJ